MAVGIYVVVMQLSVLIFFFLVMKLVAVMVGFLLETVLIHV